MRYRATSPLHLYTPHSLPSRTRTQKAWGEWGRGWRRDGRENEQRNCHR